MSYRREILTAFADKVRTISVANGFNTDLAANVSTELVLWDEVTTGFPFVCITAGSETREYLPSGFKWGFVNLTARVYTYGDLGIESLDKLIQDIERLADRNQNLEFDTGKTTTDINLLQIVTDEGVLLPFSVAEMNFTVRYPVPQ